MDFLILWKNKNKWLIVVINVFLILFNKLEFIIFLLEFFNIWLLRYKNKFCIVVYIYVLIYVIININSWVIMDIE